MRLLSSALPQRRSSGLTTFSRTPVSQQVPPGLEPIYGYGSPSNPRNVVGRGQVLFPRWVPGVGLVSVPTDVSRLPPGWQSMTMRQAQRLASCEETGCPLFLGGWTEVISGDGNSSERQGIVTSEEAAQTVGYYMHVAPAVIHHPPGTVCPGDRSQQQQGEALHPSAHKTAAGEAPVYVLNGKMIGWSQFEDSLGGGLYRAQQIQKEGRY